MALGKLIQVDTYTVSTPVGSVILGGGSSGSSGLNVSIDTNDVYMVVWYNVHSSVDAEFWFRVTKSGTGDTSANYDYADKLFNPAGFGRRGVTGDTKTHLENISLQSNQEQGNGISYLYNFNDANELSYYTYEQSNRNISGQSSAPVGGCVHTVRSASDGVLFTLSTGNITHGTFTLYKQV